LHKEILAQRLEGGAPRRGGKLTFHLSSLSHNLPHQPSPFIGREKEMATVSARLRNPDCRLLTLVGPGGVGKTCLAVEAAAEYHRDPQNAGGVYYVSLAALGRAYLALGERQAAAQHLANALEQAQRLELPEAALATLLVVARWAAGSDARGALALLAFVRTHDLAPQPLRDAAAAQFAARVKDAPPSFGERAKAQAEGMELWKSVSAWQERLAGSLPSVVAQQQGNVDAVVGGATAPDPLQKPPVSVWSPPLRVPASGWPTVPERVCPPLALSPPPPSTVDHESSYPHVGLVRLNDEFTYQATGQVSSPIGSEPAPVMVASDP
jgi:hypothetical protein